MTGDLYINNKDAYNTWGIVMGENSLTALLAPAPVKGYIQNKSALIDGKQVLTAAGHTRVDERDLQLTFFIKANTLDQFMERYSDFVAELEKGALDIKTKYQPNVIYHCLYISCAQFAQYNGRLGKFVLKLNEPNPKNRL